jgi:hypothetical protein
LGSPSAPIRSILVQISSLFPASASAMDLGRVEWPHVSSAGDDIKAQLLVWGEETLKALKRAGKSRSDWKYLLEKSGMVKTAGVDDCIAKFLYALHVGALGAPTPEEVFGIEFEKILEKRPGDLVEILGGGDFAAMVRGQETLMKAIQDLGKKVEASTVHFDDKLAKVADFVTEAIAEIPEGGEGNDDIDLVGALGAPSKPSEWPEIFEKGGRGALDLIKDLQKISGGGRQHAERQGEGDPP